MKTFLRGMNHGAGFVLGAMITLTIGGIAARRQTAKWIDKTIREQEESFSDVSRN